MLPSLLSLSRSRSRRPDTAPPPPPATPPPQSHIPLPASQPCKTPAGFCATVINSTPACPPVGPSPATPSAYQKPAQIPSPTATVNVYKIIPTLGRTDIPPTYPCPTGHFPGHTHVTTFGPPPLSLPSLHLSQPRSSSFVISLFALDLFVFPPLSLSSPSSSVSVVAVPLPDRVEHLPD